MNPYKKIKNLEKRIDKLTQENEDLSIKNKEAEKIRIDCELKVKLADEQKLTYQRLCNELSKEKDEYKSLLKEMKSQLNKINKTYKLAMKDIKNDLKK